MKIWKILSHLYEWTGRAIALPPVLALAVVKMLKFCVKFFMLWARHCQASYPVWGQVLLCFTVQHITVLEPI